MSITVALPRRAVEHRLAPSALLIAAAAAALAWSGWRALDDVGTLRAIHAGQVELAGPSVLAFVAVVFALEQLHPAQRRPLLARGHVLDGGYLLGHALVVVPLVVLIGAGFSTALVRVAPWLALPRIGWLPRWLAVALAVVAIDGIDWLTHLANHRLGALWPLHAVHHSQEELSILSTFRAHPLVHVSFLLSALPVLALSGNAATPAVVLTAYSCLGALPHANLPWTYGRLGSIAVSPAYHRRHHSPTERLDVNLGTVLTVWDRLTGRAITPAAVTAGQPAPPTGLAGRPVPVEQTPLRPRYFDTLLRQLAQPFGTTLGVNR